MNQYIFILVWVLFLGVLYKIKRQQGRESHTIDLYKDPSIWYCIILVLPVIISAALRTTFGDQGYKIEYRTLHLNFSELIELLNSGGKGPGYTVITYIGTKLVGNNAEVFFFMIAVFQMYSLMKIYRKYSVDLWLAFFIFISTADYLSWMQNGIRQFIAVTLILLFSDWMFEKKYMKFLIVVLVAATVHSSALLMIPIMILVQGKAFNKRTILATIAVVILIATLDKAVPIVGELLSGTEYSGVITDWQTSGNDGVNIFRVLVYSVPMILALAMYKTIRAYDDKIINVLCNMSVMSTLLYIVGMFTSGIYIGRLPIYCTLYTNGILLPWLVNKAYKGKIRNIMYATMVPCYCLFYYYQTHFVWGLI